MILYDSRSWLSMMRVRGSIFPAAMTRAIPSALLGMMIKFTQNKGWLGENLQTLENSSAYSGFTFVLGFILVFRTSEAYKRYCIAATSISSMQNQFYHAASNLIAFASISKKPKEDLDRYKHKVVRLFCLLHAMAIEEIACLVDENFPLLDIEGLSKNELKILGQEAAAGRKMEIVYQWVKVFIITSMDEGLLSVPPPILSRVFQELGMGLMNYHDAQQVVIWPFPFCYAQMNYLLLCCFMLLTPSIMAVNTPNPVYSGLLTLVSCICMLGLDCIAAELENPFGEDANDLPCWEMQVHMNRDLLLLLQPPSWSVPDLVPEALSTEELLNHRVPRKSLAQYINDDNKFQRPTKLAMQQHWADQLGPTSQRARMRSALGLMSEMPGEKSESLNENVAISLAKDVEQEEKTQVIAEPLVSASIAATVSAEKKPGFEMPTQPATPCLEACFERHLRSFETLIQELSSHLQSLLHEQRNHHADFQKHCISTLDSIRANVALRSLDNKKTDGRSMPMTQWPCGGVMPAPRDLQVPSN